MIKKWIFSLSNTKQMSVEHNMYIEHWVNFSNHLAQLDNATHSVNFSNQLAQLDNAKHWVNSKFDNSWEASGDILKSVVSSENPSIGKEYANLTLGYSRTTTSS